MSHWPPLIKARLQRLDHAMIFVLIAGSYTPVTLLALEPAWGITFLVLAWGIAAGGAILALWHIETIHRFAAFLYIGFGWLLVLALPAVLRALDRTELILLAGGLLYTVGAIGLWLKRPEPQPEDVRVPRGVARDDAPGRRAATTRSSCCSSAARYVSVTKPTSRGSPSARSSTTSARRTGTGSDGSSSRPRSCSV